MLLFRYREVTRGLHELEAVKDDRRATLALLAKARSDDAPPNLRMMIVQKLGNHAGAETVEVLGDVLKNDPHWSVRAAATRALGNIHDERARELLDEAAECDPHRRVRENARFNRANPMAFPRL